MSKFLNKKILNEIELPDWFKRRWSAGLESSMPQYYKELEIIKNNPNISYSEFLQKIKNLYEKYDNIQEHEASMWARYMNDLNYEKTRKNRKDNNPMKIPSWFKERWKNRYGLYTTMAQYYKELEIIQNDPDISYGKFIQKLRDLDMNDKNLLEHEASMWAKYMTDELRKKEMEAYKEKKNREKIENLRMSKSGNVNLPNWDKYKKDHAVKKETNLDLPKWFENRWTEKEIKLNPGKYHNELNIIKSNQTMEYNEFLKKLNKLYENKDF